MTSLPRRTVITGLAAGAALAALPGQAVSAQVLTRAIPKSGERIPLIGMGSWITFNVGTDARLRGQRTEVLRTFFEIGGGMVDSSPMYGSSEAVIGHALEKLDRPIGLFAATKV